MALQACAAIAAGTTFPLAPRHAGGEGRGEGGESPGGAVASESVRMSRDPSPLSLSAGWGERRYSHPLFRNHLSIVNAITMQTPQKIGYEIAYLFSGIGMFIP